MEVRSLENFICPQATAVALGTFDGLHLGHRAVIEAACRQTGLSPLVFSVMPQIQTDLLLTNLHRQQLLAEMGVHTLLPVPLETIRQLSPADFFWQILIQKLRARHLVCGFNFRFGKNAAGDLSLLQQFCRQEGIALTMVEAVEQEGLPVSSSRIRKALQTGEIALANRMLGRAYGFTAPVIMGQRLGRKLGFPTINQAVPHGLILPLPGVYAAKVTVDNTSFFGVCNLGRHPSVGALSAPQAETHLLDFSGDLYGRPVTLELLAFLREEQRFSSLEQLQAEIAKNVEQTRTFIGQMEGDCHETV